ncbi:MAG: hypothetical protein AB1648_02815 [Pseudomonadota bacterium]
MALTLIALQLSSLLRVTCIVPVTHDEHPVLLDCAGQSSHAHESGDHHAQVLLDCAAHSCINAISSSGDDAVLKKQNPPELVIWIATAILQTLISAALLEICSYASRRRDFRLRERGTPLIYQFCSLLN